MAENVKKDKAKDTSETKRCFVMMPFSTPDNYEANHFKKVYEQIITPAVELAGYKPYRVDENNISDSIINKIFDGITKSDMAICDLSSRNPNVLYELGLRHAFDLPVVLICDEITEPIFDVSGITIIKYRHSRLYDEVQEDQKAITDAIKANAENKSGYSMVSITNANKSADTSVYTNTDTDTSINNALITRLIKILEYVEKDKIYTKNITGTVDTNNIRIYNELLQNDKEIDNLENIVLNLLPIDPSLYHPGLKNNIENLIIKSHRLLNEDFISVRNTKIAKAQIDKLKFLSEQLETPEK